MSRYFDGTDDEYIYTVPASGINITGAHTFLIVLRIMVTGDSTWLSFLGLRTSAPASAGGLLRSAFTGRSNWSNAANLSQDDVSTPITDSLGWLILAADKPAGSALCRHHQTIVGGTAEHGDGGATVSSPASIANGFIHIGGPTPDFSNMRVAAAAIFDRQISDGEFEDIANELTTQSIYDLTPVWLVDDDDAFAADYMGNADRTSTGGAPADDGDDPSGWVYGVSGPAGPSQRFMWMP